MQLLYISVDEMRHSADLTYYFLILGIFDAITAAVLFISGLNNSAALCRGDNVRFSGLY